MTKELRSELEGLGLSDKEAKAYLAAVKHGTHPTSYLAKKAGLNRGTAYLALHSLLEKGLVTKNVKNNVQLFSPLQPESIKGYLKRRQEELESKLERADELVAGILALQGAAIKKPKVQFYDGVEGARTAMMQMVDTEDEYLRSFLSIHDVAEFLGAQFFEEFTNERIKRGPKLRTIRNRSKDEQAFEANPYAKKYMTNPKDKREARYLEQPVEFPMSIYLYEDKVLTLASRDEGFALVIESRDLNSMLKSLFEVLWAISVEVGV